MPHTDNLVLGKGKLFFQPFAAGQTAPTGKGWRFIGNVPTLTVNQEIQNLDHYTSTGGIRVKDRSVTLQSDMSGQFTTDHIGTKNLAMLFGGSDSNESISSASNITENFTSVEVGTYIQIGTTNNRPEGLGSLSNLSIVAGSDTLVAGTDYDADLDTGMIYLRDDSVTLTTGENITVRYNTVAKTRSKVIDESKEIYGALRFIADNPVGDNRDYTWAYVKVTASGDFGLITEEWQTMTFAFEVQKRGASLPRVVATGRPA